MTYSPAFFGGSPTSPMRFASGGLTRGRIQGGAVGGVNYPSPFFDVAHTYLPTTIKQLFKFCRYYTLTNALINAIVMKLSEYPITDIEVDHEDAKVTELWKDYLQNTARIRPFQIECGLDYNAYGNSLTSLSFPFQKYLTCPSCKFTEQAKKIRNHWLYTSNEFRLSCPRCHSTGAATPQDWYYRDASSIRPVRWNVEDVEINYNEITGETTHFYTIPAPIRADITLGKKDVVEGMPQIFLQAIRQQKGVVFSKSNLFHLRRATLAGQDRGWGIPLILPVLKDAFYLQVMRKAQEAILLEHIVPLRIIFPQAASGTSDPFTTVSLVDWRDQVAQEIARWRHDNNYMPIMPLPLGSQSIGGDGKAMLLSGEMMQLGEQLIMGMGVPREFLQGGLSYAGTNVSMRMLENMFISYINRQLQMVRWMVSMVASYMEWPKPDIRFKPFKMADDMQRKAYLFQLNQAQKISDTTLLADVDLHQDDEDEIMNNELDRRLRVQRKMQAAQAEIQGEAQVIMMKMQAKAQQAMAQAQQQPAAPGEPGGPPTGPGAPPAEATAFTGPPPPQPLPTAPPAPAPEAAGGIPAEAQSKLNLGQDLGGAPGEEKMPVDIIQLAAGYAQQLIQMPPEQREQALAALSAQMPELAQLVTEMLATMQQQQGAPAAPSVDMRPLPDVRPPRREAALV
jgi:ssDNA-binding Zn-finger/Zn-ribbon topoisomerase 1